MKKDHKPAGPSQRMLRVGELVRHALATLFARGDIEDEALAGAVITVPEVRMTPDLKIANAYVMPLGGIHADEIVAALNRLEGVQGVEVAVIDENAEPINEA